MWKSRLAIVREGTASSRAANGLSKEAALAAEVGLLQAAA